MIIVVLPFLILLLSYFGYIKFNPRYTTMDKESALSELALQLLRIRDGESYGIKENGHLELLAHDLLHTARITANLQDSDDSSDEEQRSNRRRRDNNKGGVTVTANVGSVNGIKKRKSRRASAEVFAFNNGKISSASGSYSETGAPRTPNPLHADTHAL